MSREELRWLFDTDLLHDRTYRFAEAGDCLLGLKYVDNAEAVLALSGNMNQEALEREVGWRLHAALAVREPANDFLVLLLSEAGHLVDRHDEHLRPSSGSEHRRVGLAGGASIFPPPPPPTLPRMDRLTVEQRRSIFLTAIDDITVKPGYSKQDRIKITWKV